MPKGIIICAMHEEIIPIAKHLGVSNLSFPRGQIREEGDYVYVVTDAWKVNAALFLAKAISAYPEISWILNIGLAGGIGEDFRFGEVVMGEACFEHDGKIEFSPLTQERLYPTLPLTTLSSIGVKQGIIATGDQFISSTTLQWELRKRWASVVEMECASLAKVARSFGKNITSFKIISDHANDEAKNDFENNITLTEQILPHLDHILTSLNSYK